MSERSMSTSATTRKVSGLSGPARVRVLRLGLAAFMAAASAFGLASLLYLFGQLSIFDTTHDLLLRRASAARGLPVVASLIEQFPYVLLFLISFPAAWWKSGTTARKINERYFAEFDDYLFERLTPPQSAVDCSWESSPGDAMDSPLPWIEPFHGLRATAWASLESLLANGVSVSATVWPVTRPTILIAFAWLVIVGRPGSGKTRLVEEFARRKGRADAFEASTWSWQTRLLQWTDWIHRASWFRGRVHHRIWDVGKIKMFCDEAALQRWAPRRPTLLILDEPRPGACSRALHALNHASRRWRHPVRLVIVDQSLASDLPIQFQYGQWVAERGVPPLVGPPVILDETARFTKGEVEILLARTNLVGRLRWRYDSEALTQFMSATEGNPLLVELGLDWLRREQPLAEMSRSRLLADRVRRILQAFASVGIDESCVENLRALACATLVGPHAARAPIVEEFGELPVGERMRRLIPADSRADVRVELPAVRPETIGDALVHAVVDLSDAPLNAKRIVRAGARANPGRWLRALRRLTHDPHSALSTALCAPVDLAVFDADTRADALRTYVEVGLFRRLSLDQTMRAVLGLLQEQARESGDWNDLRAMAWRAFEQTVALDWGVRVAALQAETHFDAHSSFARTHDIVTLGLRIFNIGLDADERFTAPVVSRAERVSQLAFVLDHALRRERTYIEWTEDARLLSEAVHALFPDDDSVLDRVTFDACERLDEILRGRYSHLGVSQSIFECLRRLSPDEPSLHDVVTSCRRRCATHGDDSRSAIEHIEQLCGHPDHAADLRLQLERLRAWRMMCSVPRMDLLPPGAAPFTMVEQILAQADHVDNPAMRLEYAQAWCALTCASVADDAQMCLRGAEVVESATNAETFVDAADLQYERIVAWRCRVELLMTDDLPAALLAAEAVERIGGRRVFAADRDIQFTRLQSFRHMVAAHAGRDLSVAFEYADRLERIAGAGAFDMDRNIQLERVRSWRLLAEASWQPQPARCALALEHVERVAMRPEYSSDALMQWERASAWDAWSKAAAYRRHEVKDDAAAADVERIVHKIISICAVECFADDGDIQYLRMRALFGLLSLALQRNQIPEAAEIVALVDDIAGTSEFSNSRHIQYERVFCWAYFAMNIAFKDIDRCLEAAARAEAIGGEQTFAADLQMQRARMMAFDAASTAAWLRDAGLCAEVAAHAEAIGARPEFQGDIEIQRCRLKIWNRLAHLRSSTDLSACQQIVERIDAIATRADLLGDRSIQLERIEAWRQLVFGQALARADFESSMARVESLTTSEPFLTDHDFQYQRAAAWTSVALCCLPRGDDSALRAAVSRVESITSPEHLLRSGIVQSERVRAWSHLAGVTKDIPTCTSIAQHIETVIRNGTFGEYEPLLLNPRVSVWHKLSALLVNDVEACVQAVQMVESLACGNTEVDITRLRACSWLHLINVYRDVDLQRCREVAEKIEQITSQPCFASNTELQFMCVRAWCAMTEALQILPTECRAAAHKVERMTTLPAFAENDEFQSERLQAWQHIERNPHLTQSERDDASSRIARMSTETVRQADLVPRTRAACLG